MPTPSDTKMRLLVGGQYHEDWETYDVDSDLLIPSDAWRVTLGLRQGELPPEASAGAPVEVRIGDERVMTSRIASASASTPLRSPVGTRQPTWLIARHQSSRRARRR